MKSIVRKLILGSAALAISMFVATVTTVTVNQVRAPGVVPLVSGLPIGWAQATLAYQDLTVKIARAPTVLPDTQISESQADLAMKAYAAEPLAVQALAIIGLNAQREKNDKLASDIFQRAGALSRRNQLVNAWLVQDYGIKQDNARAFERLGQSIQTEPKALDVYAPRMAAALSDPRAPRLLAPLIGLQLENGQRWTDSFWDYVVKSPASLRNAADLRILLIDAPYYQRSVQPADPNLLSALVKALHFDKAYALAQRLRSAQPDNRDNGSVGTSAEVLRNHEFASEPQLPPFDWSVLSNASFGGYVDTKSKAMVISALPGSGGVVAQQLINLSPGSYTLRTSIAAGKPGQAAPLRMRITCATPRFAANPPPPVRIANGRQAYAFEISETECRWYWFYVELIPAEDGPPLDIAIDTISLRSR